jgi:hypothetical protein
MHEVDAKTAGVSMGMTPESVRKSIYPVCVPPVWAAFASHLGGRYTTLDVLPPVLYSRLISKRQDCCLFV